MATGLVATGTPVRLRIALGTLGGVVSNRWHVIARNALSWPERRNKALRGFVPMKATDVWSVASASCPTPYRGEVEQDMQGVKAWWWPMDDQPGTGGILPSSLRNAARGNTVPLNILLSPAGAGPSGLYSTTGHSFAGYVSNPYAAGLQFGIATYNVATDAGWMPGDPQSSPQSAQSGNPATAQPGSAAVQFLGEAGNTGSNCWYLSVRDPDFPPLSGGVTVEQWFKYPYAGTTKATTVDGHFIFAQQPPCPLTLITLTTDSLPVAVLQMDASGHLSLITYAGATPTTHTVYTASDLRSGSYFHACLLLTQTTWRVLVNGGATCDVSGTAAGMTSAWTWLLVQRRHGRQRRRHHLRDAARRQRVIQPPGRVPVAAALLPGRGALLGGCDGVRAGARRRSL